MELLPSVWKKISGNFRRRTILKNDGIILPKGETVQAINQKLTQKKTESAKAADAAADPASREQKPVQFAVPNAPSYRKEVFKGERRQEWEEFYRTVENRPDLFREEKRIIQDIFAAEGGRDTHKGTQAFAGILPKTLKRHIEQGNVENIISKHGNAVKNTDLDSQDIIDMYKTHLNSGMSSAILGHARKNPDQPKTGT